MAKDKKGRFKIFCKPSNIPFEVAEDKVKDFERDSKNHTLEKALERASSFRIVDTNSKEYIETQAYNKFEERILTRLIDKIATLKELFKGNMYVEQSIKTMNSVIDDIKDIRNELTKEMEDNDRK